jgi:translation initiation factor IF-3
MRCAKTVQHRTYLELCYQKGARSIKKKKFRINQQIRRSTVTLIDHQGKLIGDVPIQQALEHAEEAKLDLVEVSPNEEPPVCKILDAKKEAYNQSKKARDSRKKSRNVRLKEIRLSCRISDNDLDLKLKKALEFLQQGDRVKFNLRFKGREIMHGDLGRAVMVKVKKSRKPSLPMPRPNPISRRRAAPSTWSCFP